MTDPAIDSLRLRLEAPETVASGSSVPFAIVIENRADRPSALSLRGRTIAFDLLVRNPAGAIAWQRLAGQSIPAILRLEELAPGATLRLTATWDQRGSDGALVPPGRYQVEGLVLTDGEPLRAGPVDLLIR